MRQIPNRRRVVAVLTLLCALGLLSPVARATSHGTITFTGLEAALTMSDDPRTGGSIVSLLVDPALFGRGGFVRGDIQFGGATPDDGMWLTDPFGGATPDDNMPALSFLINSADEVSGVEPTPFRLFVAGGGFVGELDFAAVGGMLGSLHLNGVQLHEVDATGNRTGTTYDVNPFTIEAVPLPAAAWLFGSALLGLAGLQRRRRRDLA